MTPEYARDWIRAWEAEVRRVTRQNGGEPWLLLADEWYTRAGVQVPALASATQRRPTACVT